MFIKSEEIISITDANKNFSKATRIAEKNGRAVVFKNNKPRYLLIDIEKDYIPDLTEDEIIKVVSDRVLAKYMDAYLELAK